MENIVKIAVIIQTEDGTISQVVAPRIQQEMAVRMMMDDKDQLVCTKTDGSIAFDKLK